MLLFTIILEIDGLIVKAKNKVTASINQSMNPTKILALSACGHSNPHLCTLLQYWSVSIQITFPGSEKMADILIKKGANVMQSTDSQVTALHVTAYHGKFDN